MSLHTPVIETPRLRLELMTPQWLALCIQGDSRAAAKLAGYDIPEDWFQNKSFIQHKTDQCAATPEYLPWCTRAIVLASDNRMIGQIGFHEPPDPPHLCVHGPGTIEFGYTIYDAYRRQGYATEAVLALMKWSIHNAGIRQFVLSIAPDNAASHALARRFGFRKIGEQMDEADGLEEVLLLESSMLFGQVF